MNKTYARTETLGVPIGVEDGSQETLEFSSADPLTIIVRIVSEDGETIKYVGIVDFADFLDLCRRALEIWEKEEVVEK